MKKVIFLDRDGVINNDTGHYYIYKPDDFVLNLGLIDGLLKLKYNGYEFVIISNQGGIARGIYSKAEVELVHQKLIGEFMRYDLSLLEIYYCPHHNEIEKCLCRKPESLMIEKAIARFAVDTKKSYFIGDSEKDMQAAKNAGIQGISIKSNQNIQTILSQINND
ncbi:MAG: HAD family hydrolase [Salinivirgaceae bacterium]|jgi:D-glycero-D-manno-heptose 1,7-bisphosphate phosphatase